MKVVKIIVPTRIPKSASLKGGRLLLSSLDDGMDLFIFRIYKNIDLGCVVLQLVKAQLTDEDHRLLVVKLPLG